MFAMRRCLSESKDTGRPALLLNCTTPTSSEPGRLVVPTPGAEVDGLDLVSASCWFLL
jgi:hypothetical protein